MNKKGENMKQGYLKFLVKIKQFRKSLISEVDKKRGKLYFIWLRSKTEKIQNENNDVYFYNNIVNDTLKNYKIDKYTYNKLNNKLKQIVDRNYILQKGNYIFNNYNISFDNAMLILKKILLKRGNVVWIDFGFNIGNEFGGIHPAIILKSFDKELFVVPVSSKKPKKYIQIEQEFKDKMITKEELKKEKDKITAVMQIDKIYRFKKMTRWIDITRIRKVSLLRLNYTGTIGRISGKDLEKISEKIGKEF